MPCATWHASCCMGSGEKGAQKAPWRARAHAQSPHLPRHHILHRCEPDQHLQPLLPVEGAQLIEVILEDRVVFLVGARRVHLVSGARRAVMAVVSVAVWRCTVMALCSHGGVGVAV
eukprot:3631817-Prymnesium_polylepis.1